VRVCQFRHTGWASSYSVKSLDSQTKLQPLRFRTPAFGANMSHAVRCRVTNVECPMNEEALNMSLRKFLKIVGVTSQQEIEKAIRAAVADGRLKGNETVSAQMVLTIGKVGLTHKIDGEIMLG
jgi:hypothetical protein